MAEESKQGLIVPFGKFKGQPIEVLLAHAEYGAWLLAQPGFAERFPHIADFLRRGRTEEPQDTPEHNAMVDRLMENRTFWLHTAVGGSVEPFKRWKLTSAFPELKVAVTGPCRNCSRDASTWSFETFRFRGLGKPQRPSNMPDELRLCEHSEPKIGTYTAEFRCERIGGSPELQCEIEPKGADLRLTVTFFIQPEHRPQGHLVPVVRKTIIAELKPLIGDDFPSVIRQVKRAQQIYGSGAMYVVVCATLRASNLPADRVKRQFEQAGIRLLIESEVTDELTGFKDAVMAAVRDKNELWPQELADVLATPSKQISEAAALMAEVRRMNKEFCGHETAAEFEANREAAVAFAKARSEQGEA